MDKESCREIIEHIIEYPPKNANDLAKIKRMVAKKYSLAEFPRNSEILQAATDEEREFLLPILVKKPSRTMSGVAVVAVMSKPIPCPHGKCSMCPGGVELDSPQSYTGFEPAAMRGKMFDYDSKSQVRARLQQLKDIGHNTTKIDLILMGGTLPAAPLEYQESFIKGCLDGITNKESATIEEAIKFAETSERRCIGITVETRPDTCSLQNLRQLLDWGITRVEIGVQILNDSAYERINRGHTVHDVVNAFRYLRDLGLKITAHMMVGLPGISWEEELASYLKLMNDQRFIPDELKIYPLMLMEKTKLYEEYLAGAYDPLTHEETVRRVAEFKVNTLPSIRIKRILRDIPATKVFAGPKKSDLREHAQRYLEETGRKCRCIRCREVGHLQMKGISPSVKDIELIKREYDASNGKEVFLSYEDTSQDIILGFLRLRHPSKEKVITEVSENTPFSIIRELHIYGSVVGIGDVAGITTNWQHRGYGTKLISEAEELARAVGSELILVTSGIGVREYYAKRGFEYLLPYMAKKLS
ncbi:MAG: tRNA uridine(34) 5-carboxymethylaminomethyl modification radical SAM/GNAT enzyme Elp3 [Candidatus Heimdallarchaeota archaeon]|nr:tRNA uridine(34) 5-carboxymethylaminomethyl modification radical SAM/GNAT enzyme Elp3 [Candidatus Heimdallarchaeota archaeon]